MLTGQAAFQGEDITEILASVVKGGVNLDLLPTNLHPRVREAITRCLQKDLRRRYQGMADANYEIEQSLLKAGDVLTQPVISVQPRKRLRTILPWIAATAILGMMIGGFFVWRFRQLEPHQLRFDISLPEGQQFSDLYNRSSLAISPDGKQIVYCASKGLYTRSVNELTAKPIAGIEEKVSAPFFSPDGKWIGYFSVTDFRKLKKIPADGGAPEILCDTGTSISRALWNEDNTIIYCCNHEVMRVSAEGGTPDSIINLKSGILSDAQMLSDGKSILYTLRRNNGQPKIMVQALRSEDAKELFTGLDAQYVPTGHIIYRMPNNNNLFAVPFDLARLEVKGQPVSILKGVVQYAISEFGMLAYIPANPGVAVNKRTLAWVDREGKEESLSIPPNAYFDIRISPDGKRVALMVATPKSNIWIWDIINKSMMTLTFDEGAGHVAPLWTLDGKRILYSWDPENLFLGGVYGKASDGTGEVEKLASSPGRGLFPFSWSKDGKNLILWEVTLKSGHHDIGMLSMEGDHARRELLHEKYSTKEPRISPNGKWMAYASNESGKYEIYVCPFPDVKQGKWKVSVSGGNHPLWSPDGRELFYNNVDATMAVPVEIDTLFKSRTPTILFPGRAGKILGPEWADMDFTTYWDIDPTGKRLFLMLKDAAEAPRKINIVVNWFEELKRLAPKK
jgi:serine/threonine-protein kinase